eukprot:364386-Chlamydomonas_euryale.AAC.1
MERVARHAAWSVWQGMQHGASGSGASSVWQGMRGRLGRRAREGLSGAATAWPSSRRRISVV